MAKPTDIRAAATELFFLPVETRVPLKFGPETLTHVTCARARLTVRLANGYTATGWGETPLSVQWVWPSALPYEPRHEALKRFCIRLAKAWANFEALGHPLEIGHDFQQTELPRLLDSFNADSIAGEPMPWLAALVCCSLFDLALHDAFGQALGRPTYRTYTAEFLSRDLGQFLEPVNGSDVEFVDRFPNEFLAVEPTTRMPAWHLVGGLDPLDKNELTGKEPDDGFPLLLADWIHTDGLNCLKVKLRGNDAEWDYTRLTMVGAIAVEHGVLWLSADFNCTVNDPAYVNEILDRLVAEQPRIYGMILYVEQPFPYELETNRIDVHSVSARKPLFLDESAHDWKLIRLGRELGWTGVALKTCKTQTGAILSACWAKAHGMTLMVQDLTNPMLAQIPHVQLAAQVGTIMGVETNSMQFYPEASAAEAKVHSGIYRRHGGQVDLSTLYGPGFGYRLENIARDLPKSSAAFGEI
ncbi:MAG TPA: enolase C-terminal domain-like protein [Verrucomicrobiota bacterium]|jgi:L-alanine-DL-glutamate epimerase-like enolase superfamily enzyme|nr:enolase C-terminal domain-like protein [Verrucomicrobiota bacterium]